MGWDGVGWNGKRTNETPQKNTWVEKNEMIWPFFPPAVPRELDWTHRTGRAATPPSRATPITNRPEPKRVPRDHPSTPFLRDVDPSGAVFTYFSSAFHVQAGLIPRADGSDRDAAAVPRPTSDREDDLQRG